MIGNGHILSRPASVRLLSRADRPAVVKLRDFVLSTLNNPDLYVRETDEGEMLSRNLGGIYGETVGVLMGDFLIAYGMVAYPRAKDRHNLARSLPVPFEDLSAVAVMESAMVHPLYRCTGWQQSLLRIRARLASERRKSILMAAASLANWIGRHNLLRAGYMIAGCTILESSLRRHLFLRQCNLQPRHGEPTITIDPLDYAKQRQLIHAGFVGVTESNPRGKGSLGYQRLQKQMDSSPLKQSYELRN